MNYPGQHPRRLQRSRTDRWIGGVCGGIAEYLNMDPTLVRVLAVVLAVLTSGVPVAIIYLVLMAILPEADPANPSSIGPARQFPWQQQWRQNQYPPPQQNQDPVWGPSGPPWNQRNPDIDTSAPQPPRQTPEDLFSRAKHPTEPSSPPGGPGTPPSDEPGQPPQGGESSGA